MNKKVVYGKTKKLSVADMRGALLNGEEQMLPSFRTVCDTHAFYNDEAEEILFFNTSNTLVYVKILGAEKEHTLEQFMDDYATVCNQLARQCKKEGTQASSVECMLVSESFSEKFLARCALLGGMNLRVCVVKHIQLSAQEEAYCVEELFSTGQVTTPTPEPVMEALVSDDDETSLEEENTHTIIGSNEVVADEAVAVSPIADPMSREAIGFFERAQLSEEEEKEFFLLNKELSEYVR